MPGVSVSEIHRYPSRPAGFEELLFVTPVSKRAVGEHLLKSPWLVRASELRAESGESARAFREPVAVRECAGGVEVVRLSEARGIAWRRKLVVEPLERWREVRNWWSEKDGADRQMFRVLLSGGTVVDLALERSGKWLLTGVAD